ncbi:hypothetical protein DTO166G4_8026 [Paecilomyces variotii]|nr:hypothetical protein DTO166G4_8026 [Paecilomyces variotii]KAJ9228471.1 hypothetical protein DTO166G5_8568 [Paecilomyces variotii]
MPFFNEEDKQGLEVALGPLGTGIYYIGNAVAPADNPKWLQGEALRRWSLAYNNDEDLIFMRTEGYHWGYLYHNRAPGGARFLPSGMAVKSRESGALFDVMTLLPGKECDRGQMVEFARRWGGYEVTGDEKEYYMSLILAAKRGEGTDI